VDYYSLISVYHCLLCMLKPNSWGFLGYFNCTQPNCVFFVCLLLWGYETWWTRWFVANMWTWTPQEEMRGVRSTCWHEHGKSCSSKGAFTKITGRSPFRKGRELHQLEIAIFGGSTLAVWILFMFKKMFFSKRSAILQSMFKSFNEGYSGVLT
jgi:hypothetical protein